MTCPAISVIIPIYNAIKSLSICIESIISQTYTNYECILVDDGSNDGSGHVCDLIGSKNLRFQVYHKINGGVSSARNLGISVAKGEWLCFVDADDSLEPDYLTNLIAKANDADLVVGGYLTNNTVSCPNDRYYYGNEIADYCNNVVNRLYGKVPWGKLYKRSIINENNLHFDDNIRLGEDLVFNLTFLKSATSIRTINEAGYLYSTNSSNEVKYNLRLQEINYVNSCVTRLEHQLSDIFNNGINLSYSKSIILAVYPYSQIISSLNDKDYFSSYQQIFPNSTREQFIADNICSPIIRGLLYMIYCYRMGEKADFYLSLNYLSQNYKNKLRSITYPYKKLNLLSFCLRHDMIGLMSLVLSVDSIKHKG